MAEKDYYENGKTRMQRMKSSADMQTSANRMNDYNRAMYKYGLNGNDIPNQMYEDIALYKNPTERNAYSMTVPKYPSAGSSFKSDHGPAVYNIGGNYEMQGVGRGSGFNKGNSGKGFAPAFMSIPAAAATMAMASPNSVEAAGWGGQAVASLPIVGDMAMGMAAEYGAKKLQEAFYNYQKAQEAARWSDYYYNDATDTY